MGTTKNDTSYLKLIVEANRHKREAVQPPAYDFKNHSSKTNKMLEKRWRTHKQRSVPDSNTWYASFGRPAWSYLDQLRVETGCSQVSLPRKPAMDNRDRFLLY